MKGLIKNKNKILGGTNKGRFTHSMPCPCRAHGTTWQENGMGAACYVSIGLKNVRVW